MMFQINRAGLILPVLYVVVLVASVYTIYTLYQKHQMAKLNTLKPWFSPHLQRNVYLSLLHLETPDDSKDLKDLKTPEVPRSILRAALLRRAMEDIRRIINVRTKKQACGSLLEKRSVGDDLWHQLLLAEKEMEVELKDVVKEANGLVPDWGQTIFQTANEMVAKTKLSEDLEAINSKLNVEKELWEPKRVGG